MQTKDGGVISAVVDEALKYPDSDPKIPSEKDQQQNLLRETFSGLLVNIDEESGVAVRRQARTTEIPEHLKPMIIRLVEARLLSRDIQNGAEIAHDSVLESWEPLRDWIKSDQPFLVALNRIEKAQQDWRDVVTICSEQAHEITHVPVWTDHDLSAESYQARMRSFVLPNDRNGRAPSFEFMVFVLQVTFPVCPELAETTGKIGFRQPV